MSDMYMNYILELTKECVDLEIINTTVITDYTITKCLDGENAIVKQNKYNRNTKSKNTNHYFVRLKADGIKLISEHEYSAIMYNIVKDK